MPLCSKQNEPSDATTIETSVGSISPSTNNFLTPRCEMCNRSFQSTNFTTSRKSSTECKRLRHSCTGYFGGENHLYEKECCHLTHGDVKQLNHKYDKLESQLNELNKKLNLLTTCLEKQQNISLNATSVYCYQTFNSLSPQKTSKKTWNILKTFRRLFHFNNGDSADQDEEYKKNLLFRNSSADPSHSQSSIITEKNSKLDFQNNDVRLLSITDDRPKSQKFKHLERHRSSWYEKNGTSLGARFAEFCENTSIHGFPLLHRAESVYMKILWVLVITFSFLGSGYEIFNVVNDFRLAPTSTVYEFETPDDGLIFPEVVLCNSNFLNATKARRSNYTKGVINAAKFMILNPIEDVIGSVFDPTYAYLNRNLADSDKAAEFNYLPDVLEQLQYEQKEFIKACFFDQQPCEIFNVSIVEAPDAEYGVCFLVKVNSLQTKSGEGLQLVLDTHSENFWTEQPTFGHGVIVRIEKTYNPGVLRSYFVLPSYITKISLSAIHYQMLDTSNNCRDDMNREIFNSKVTYSEDICRMECFFRVALKLCGCIRSMPPEYLREATLPQCFNSTQQVCLKQAYIAEKQDQEAQICKRQCIPPCDSWDYRASLSMLKFPAPPVMPVMEMMHNKSANESRFGDHVVLDIAFDQLRVTNIRQQESITSDGFLSQIGGHLGLFMGASLMSVVHMLVSIAQWSCRLLQKRFSKKGEFSLSDRNL